MEQRDLIKDQLELVGKALSKIIADFLKLKSSGNTPLAIEQTNTQLKSELDLDINLMLGFSQQQLANYLIEKKIPPPHLEILIEYFVEMGEYTIKQNTAKGQSILAKALELYKVLDLNTNTYSFKRREKEQKIKQLLLIN